MIYTENEDSGKAFASLDAPAIASTTTTTQHSPQTVSPVHISQHIDVNRKQRSTMYAITNRIKKEDRFTGKIGKK